MRLGSGRYPFALYREATASPLFRPSTFRRDGIEGGAPCQTNLRVLGARRAKTAAWSPSPDRNHAHHTWFMKNEFGCGVLLLIASVGGADAAGRCGDHPWCDTSLAPDTRAGLLLEQLTQEIGRASCRERV